MKKAARRVLQDKGNGSWRPFAPPRQGTKCRALIDGAEFMEASILNPALSLGPLLCQGPTVSP